MNTDERIEALLLDLDDNLRDSAMLVTRGRAEFDSDLALRLAFEALSNRVGDIAKRLVQLDSERFAEPVWSFAAKNRDKIVHHYQLVAPDILWATVHEDFPSLRALALRKRAS
ncbi:MAG: HepT-like ribonuclease domain-containing protein [Rhodoglobus sp.]